MKPPLRPIGSVSEQVLIGDFCIEGRFTRKPEHPFSERVALNFIGAATEGHAGG